MLRPSHGRLWSPATNRRADEYNGSLDNRLRFSLRVLEAVRKAVGPDYIVGCRLAADEDWDKGFTKEQGVEICRRLRDSGLVDFLNVIKAAISTTMRRFPASSRCSA